MPDRARDMAEAVTNAVVGLCVSVLAVHAVWPLFGWSVALEQSVAVSGLFFGLSALRSFVIRRVFRAVAARKDAEQALGFHPNHGSQLQ